MAQEMTTPRSSAGAVTEHPRKKGLAPGFRFHPTEEELLSYYLLMKVRGKPFLKYHPIIDIDFYNYEPSQLPDLSPSEDMIWYFFTTVDRKRGGRGSRLNRATQQGYWKSTGKDSPVSNMSNTIGLKKILVFYAGRIPHGKRTDWVMHEYRLAADEQSTENASVTQDDFVLCKMFQKNGLGPTNGTRYAPFVDEDWENNDALDIPPAGGEADGDIHINGDILRIGFNEEETQDKQKAMLLPEDSLDPQNKRIDFLSKKRERSDDHDFLSLGLCKRLKQGDPNTSNGGESEVMMTSISHVAKPNESQSASILDSSNLEKSVPPAFLKYKNKLENDIVIVSKEMDNLKDELRRAQEMINDILARTESLTKENEELRTSVGRGSG